jgi:hypothetical protein
MELSKTTVDILSCFSGINTNLVIREGNVISTKSQNSTIYAEFEGEDTFDKQVSIFNLTEFLGAYAAFTKPELILDDKYCTIKEGQQKVKYVYADESLLTIPNKSVKLPSTEIEFQLTADDLAKLIKMAGVLAVDDLVFVGDGKGIVAKVCDDKNPTGNSFDIGLDASTDLKFNVKLKVDKLKMPKGAYNVKISNKKVGQFTHMELKLRVMIALETSSSFE